MKTITTTIFAAGAALLALGAGPAAAARNIAEARPTTGNPSVEIVNVQGLVKVRGASANEVRVSGVIEHEGDEFEFSGDERHVVIRVRPEKGDHRGRRDARLEVTVPAGAQLNVQTVSADIEVEGVQGTQRLESVSGDVRTTVYTEPLDLRTISGDATVGGRAGPTVVRLESTSGNVVGRGLKGEVEAESVSGDLDLEIAAGSRVRLETVSGDVDGRLSLGAGARVEIESVSGDVELGFDEGIDAEFEIETFSGAIDNCFGPDAARKSRYAPGKELRFTQGAGAGRVRIDTMSGDISFCNR